MKRIKLVAAATMVSLGTLSMVACQKNEPEIKIQTDIQGTGIGEYKGDTIKDIIPTPPPTVPQTPQRTVIENGEVKVWAETFNRDETIKPIKYEVAEGLSVPGHYIYYNVEGHEIIVAVNEKTGHRLFYKDDTSGGTFAQIGSDVKDSNENILLQVKINDMIIENTKKKYK